MPEEVRLGPGHPEGILRAPPALLQAEEGLAGGQPGRLRCKALQPGSFCAGEDRRKDFYW